MLDFLLDSTFKELIQVRLLLLHRLFADYRHFKVFAVIAIRMLRIIWVSEVFSVVAFYAQPCPSDKPFVLFAVKAVFVVVELDNDRFVFHADIADPFLDVEAGNAVENLDLAVTAVSPHAHVLVSPYVVFWNAVDSGIAVWTEILERQFLVGRVLTLAEPAASVAERVIITLLLEVVVRVDIERVDVKFLPLAVDERHASRLEVIEPQFAGASPIRIVLVLVELDILSGQVHFQSFVANAVAVTSWNLVESGHSEKSEAFERFVRGETAREYVHLVLNLFGHIQNIASRRLNCYI